MAEYLYNETQSIALNGPVLLNNSIPCNKGNVFHEDGTGILILRGNTNNCFARYQLVFNANVAVPEAGAVTAIGIAIAVNGEPRPSSTAIFTPQAVNEFGNLTSTCIVTVPRGCCFSVSVRYVDATVNDAAVTPTPTIEIANSNLVVSRIA